MRILRAIAVLAGLIAPQVSQAQAAQLEVLESNALKTVMDELGPQFEKTTGNKLVSIVGTTTELRGMIENKSLTRNAANSGIFYENSGNLSSRKTVWWS